MNKAETLRTRTWHPVG